MNGKRSFGKRLPGWTGRPGASRGESGGTRAGNLYTGRLVESDPDLVDLPVADGEAEPELRRTYHDRIAALRSQSVAILHGAAEAAGDATAALLEPEATAGKLAAVEGAVAAAPISEVEAEVLSLLALESPVARDLRLILTSRDIAQLGELCLGLGLTLARRATQPLDVLSSELRAMIASVGEQTADLLRQASAAWSAVEADEAAGVVEAARAPRAALRSFFTELVSLPEVPVSSAVDLGLVVRVYERLIDHAVDVAGRVVFAATGTAPSRLRLALET